MISTHVLDTSKGLPAAGINAVLTIKNSEAWSVVANGTTDNDGRIVFNCPKVLGTYQITFKVEEYFSKFDSFYKSIPIVFEVKSLDRKYHVPLLLNPFGYSTYRGS